MCDLIWYYLEYIMYSALLEVGCAFSWDDDQPFYFRGAYLLETSRTKPVRSTGVLVSQNWFERNFQEGTIFFQ